jgi:hypothetical protein
LICIKERRDDHSEILTRREARMKSEYVLLLEKAYELEQLAQLAMDQSIREKSAELAQEYRARSARLREKAMA